MNSIKIIYFIFSVLSSDVCNSQTKQITTHISDLSIEVINSFFSHSFIDQNKDSSLVCEKVSSFNFETFSIVNGIADLKVTESCDDYCLLYSSHDSIEKIEIFKGKSKQYILHIRYIDHYRLLSIHKKEYFNGINSNEYYYTQCVGFFCQNIAENELFFIGYNSSHFKKAVLKTLFTNGFEIDSMTLPIYGYYSYYMQKENSYNDIACIMKLDKNLKPEYCWQIKNGELFADRRNFYSKYREVVGIIDKSLCNKPISVEKLRMSDIKYLSCNYLMRIPVSVDSKDDFDDFSWGNFFL